MNSRLKQVTFLITLLFCSLAGAHPIPDIPVRTFFPGDGTAQVTVELDPRILDGAPELAPYMLPARLAELSGPEREELKKRLAQRVTRDVEFFFEPVGRVSPEFVYEFTGKSGAPVGGAEDPVVLTGKWSTTLAAGLTGWRIRATKEGPLSIVFQNIIRGKVHERLNVLFPGETSFVLDLSGLTAGKSAALPGAISSAGSSADHWSTLFSYARQGFIHVVPGGLDHILFVLGIFLLSRSWRSVLAQVTTFTLAHSVTLALATLGWVHVPTSIVEPIIAASIAFVALENIFWPGYSHWRLLVVFVFGLIHGLGFASALSDLELPSTSLIAGLVGFNVGVEAAQVSIIAAATLLTVWLRNAADYRRWVVIPGSTAIAASGLWMAVTRVLAAR